MKNLIQTPYGKKTPELLCRAMDALEREHELLSVLERLTEKIARANAIQHSGTDIELEDWSELYFLTNEARAAIAKAKGETK
jgi:hypothetical protein